MFYMYGYFVYMYICALCVCLVTMEVRKRHWTAWNWRGCKAHVDANNKTQVLQKSNPYSSPLSHLFGFLLLL